MSNEPETPPPRVSPPNSESSAVDAVPVAVSATNLRNAPATIVSPVVTIGTVKVLAPVEVIATSRPLSTPAPDPPNPDRLTTLPVDKPCPTDVSVVTAPVPIADTCCKGGHAC